MIIVLLIAFLVVGPKDLPKVARWLGRMVKKIRQLIQEVKKETGWDEFEKELKDTKTDVDQALNDLKQDMDITPELKEVSRNLNQSLNGVKNDLKQAEKEVNNKE